MRAIRLADGPIIHPHLEGLAGDNINGPSLIRAPQWLAGTEAGRLGEYYLYFAHHKGRHIRLAHADRLTGPWTVYAPGTLQLEESHFPATLDEFAPELAESITAGQVYPHVASPDVQVDNKAGQVRLYYHGQLADGRQVSRVALSKDGVHFEAREEVLSTSYLRMIRLDDIEGPGWYGMSMPGIVYRSADGLGAFEQGPQLFPDTMRHCALLRRGDTLWVFWSNVGDTPERILASPVVLRGDWRGWAAGPAREVLRPERDWEGAHLPVAPSVRGYAPEPVNELRDPAIFEEGGRAWLLYAVQGEHGIAIAELQVSEG
ncbi:MAG: hypothetical protein F4Z77_01145 [Dehalococcoidia bacterium]|nr:hypothetical protein [Dehalococcoidia bacterium]MYA54118.1 hypothetical protein [Dehalococcoidia bacterium]